MAISVDTSGTTTPGSIASVPLQGSTGNNNTFNPQATTGIGIQGTAPVQGSNSATSVLQGGVSPQLQALQNQVAGNQSAINNDVNQTNNSSNQISSLLQSIQSEEQANVPGTPISLDVNALQGQANAAAQNTVNPLYTQYMNQYLQEEAANQQAAQAQNTLNLQGEQSGLANTLQTNQIGENTAAATNALTQGNIGVQQQNYQLQTGQAQNQKLAAIGSSIGSGNLGASGIGQQQLWQAENSRNIADAAQSGQFQYDRNSSNLSAEDTFAQLAQSSAYAQTAEGQQEAQTNFNLNDYLRQAAYNDQVLAPEMAETQEQLAQTATSNQLLATNVQNAINSSGVSGKNLAATESAYNYYLNPSTSVPNPSDLVNSLNSLQSIGGSSV